MRRIKFPILSSLLSVVVLLALMPRVHATVQVVDDAGHSVSLNQAAKRIISLSPHITELLFAAGAGDAVVGVVEFSDYPDAARSIPRIGNFSVFNIEAIIALHPDLIVAWQSGNPMAQVNTLHKLGIPVFLSEPRALDDVASNLRRLGKLAGTSVQANLAADHYTQTLVELRNRYQAQKTVSVFYQIWHQPLMTINKDHIISQAIDLCRGRNVFAELPVLDPQINIESVLLANPQMIVAGGASASYPQWKQDWLRWPQLQAVSKGHLYEMPPDILQRNSPRILQGVATLCDMIDQVRRSE